MSKPLQNRNNYFFLSKFVFLNFVNFFILGTNTGTLLFGQIKKHELTINFLRRLETPYPELAKFLLFFSKAKEH